MQWIQLQDNFQRYARSPRTPLILLVIFLLFIVLNLSATIALWLKPSVIDASTISTERVTTLADLHLFGQYNSALGAIPLTTLQLSLEGTEINDDDPSRSIAIISSAGAPAKVYFTHDQVPGGAIVHAIDHTRVILNHNGILEQLRMPSLELQRSSPTGVFASAG